MSLLIEEEANHILDAFQRPFRTPEGGFWFYWLFKIELIPGGYCFDISLENEETNYKYSYSKSGDINKVIINAWCELAKRNGGIKAFTKMFDEGKIWYNKYYK